MGLGLLGAFGLKRLMQTLLFNVSVTDPLVYVVAPAALITVATAACLVPALRAAKGDPLIAPRCE